jgi:hypothetical protein
MPSAVEPAEQRAHFEIESVTGGVPLDVQEHWYRIYADELEHHLEHADHARRRLDDPMARAGHLFIARGPSGEIAGTVLTTDRGVGELGYYEDYFDMDRIPGPASVTTKLTVAPFARRSRVSFMLSCATYAAAFERGVEVDFCDCQPSRLPLFQRMGYRQMPGKGQHPVYGSSLRMRLDVLDSEHLERVGSPFAAVARKRLRRRAS